MSLLGTLSSFYFEQNRKPRPSLIFLITRNNCNCNRKQVSTPRRPRRRAQPGCGATFDKMLSRDCKGAVAEPAFPLPDDRGSDAVYFQRRSSLSSSVSFPPWVFLEPA